MGILGKGFYFMLIIMEYVHDLLFIVCDGDVFYWLVEGCFDVMLHVVYGILEWLDLGIDVFIVVYYWG